MTIQELAMPCFSRSTFLTLSKLDGLDVRVAGLGLAAFILILFPAAGSCAVLNLLPVPDTTLLGLPVRLTGPLPFTGFGGGGIGCSIISTADGLKNIPRPISQSKYRSPCTLPSFFPLPSSSSTPTQSPGAKCGCPTNRITAIRPSASCTVWPTSSSAISLAGLDHRSTC